MSDKAKINAVICGTPKELINDTPGAATNEADNLSAKEVDGLSVNEPIKDTTRGRACSFTPLNIFFRKAAESDTERITDIYNQAVSGKCCCDTETVTPAERLSWVRSHMSDLHYPLYVGEIDGEIFGYGYLTEYRFGRPAVASTAEVSYFLDFKWHRKGLGTKFLRFLESEAQKIGFDTLVAILMASNDASVGLLKKCGYEFCGAIPNAVRIGDLITDHVYYYKTI